MNSPLNLTAEEYARQSQSPMPIRPITQQDLRHALRRGWEDFNARPMHGLFIALIYVMIALFTSLIGLGVDLLPLLFPLVSGFALLGPLAACGLYALSRRRERGEDYAWWHVFDVFTAPSRLGIAGMGIILAALFGLWLYSANALYGLFMAEASIGSHAELLRATFTTAAGWQLLLVGCGVGFMFSVVAFILTIVSLPMMLDRQVSLPQAVGTSLRAVWHNIGAMAQWYLLVAALLVLGALPLLIGWAIVVPLIAHSTWHLYRKVIDG